MCAIPWFGRPDGTREADLVERRGDLRLPEAGAAANIAVRENTGMLDDSRRFDQSPEGLAGILARRVPVQKPLVRFNRSECARDIPIGLFRGLRGRLPRQQR